jgi:alkylation response protein AidB-like acyl-CoA dehydrogenase
MASRASASLMTIVGLQAGVANDIQKYASEELKREYLPRFVSGEVQGAMDLTEPEAGSDLGGITTRATEEGDRVYLDGQKIFITNGGAEIHLVLARDGETFDQSKGTTKGLSLLLCPRTLPDGTRNNVVVERLEHKMGLHASPTAVIRFDHAEAFRVGKKGEGFKAMLDLMNEARLGVAAQGVGIAEAAVQEAIAYARQREQFGQPIADQPLMKNMLARMVLSVEGSRALLYRVCLLIDRNHAIEEYLKREADLSEAERSELERIHERNMVRIRLLTPLAKYLATECCDAVTRNAIQVHGGVGFMAESNVGRLHLDGIITTIYEGTSEIQISFALKEIGKGALSIVFDELHKEMEKLESSELQGLAEKVRVGIAQIQDSSAALLQDFNYALLCSQQVAEMVIDVIVATELLTQASFEPARLDVARSWINRRMLDVEARAKRVSSGTVERIDRCERIMGLFE